MGPEITVLLVASGSVALLGGVAALTLFLERLSRTSTHPGPGREMERAWREVAQVLEGGAVHLRVHGRPANLSGRLHGFGVTVSYLNRSEGGVRVDVDGAGRIPMGLRIRERQAELEPGLPTGDAAFHSRVCVEGEEAVVAALLDDATRSLIGESVSRHGATLQYSHLTLTSSPAADADRLRGEIESGVALARRLVAPNELPERLASIAGTDPIPTVRLRALRMLVDRWPDSRSTQLACEAASQDPDDELRLVAAIGRGTAGEATLADIACAPQTSEEQAVRALRALDRRLPAERTVALIDDALQQGRRSVVREAIRALGRTGGPLAVSRLSALARGADFDTAVESVRALGAIADVAVEPILVALLVSGSLDMRAAAAAALGPVGTAASVPPLRRVVAAHPLDIGLRRIVARSIALIQERLAGAAPGQLSLAEGETGRLSLLPDAPAGSLSSVDPVDPDDPVV